MQTSSFKNKVCFVALVTGLSVSSFNLTACQNLEHKASKPNTPLKIDTLPSGQQIVRGELIVVFQPNISKQAINALAKQHDMTVAQELGIINGFVFQSNKNLTELQKTMERLNKDPTVKYAEYNGIAQASIGNVSPMGVN